MDGIEKITGRIAADAGREIDEINAEARRQADEILARYEAQAKRESEEILSRGKRNADERVERLASVAQLDARKLELAAKQEMLSKAYDLALEKLVNLPDKDYVTLLANLAVKASSTGKEAVIFSQKDRTRYGKQVVTQANERLKDGHLTMSEQTRPIQGGLILSDGDVEVNCTFETLVRLQRGEMDREVAKVLFD
ncbi:V-type ATP synthase subunit E [uncultured Flavonifractor sp.]|uniref:V-type ATP synthase subunit E n=1 Tax=uncultured Flavonifractor sp. TaxID=1193534 RepID=UPI002605123C|nr:V-type ATP synthase subunit E family protein [uncultured Flavonifractor sp.]